MPTREGGNHPIYNRWTRWGDMGACARIMKGLAAEAATPKTVMIDATHLKAHRTASSLRVEKGGRGRPIGRTKGGMNTRLHAVTDDDGRPLRFFVTAGQVSDDTGADRQPAPADWLRADRGYDADWFREAVKNKGIKPCIPARKSRSKTVKQDKRRSRRRNRIETMSGRLKHGRRVATRYDRSPKAFLSAVALAATVLFWL